MTGGDRGGSRSRQSDRRRDLDRDRRAAADAVRLGPDGPLHGADPGQRLGGDGVLFLRRHGDRALADAAARRHGAGRGTHDAHHDEGRLGVLYRRVAAPIIATRKRAPGIFLIGVGVATLPRCSAVRHQDRDGEAAAVRQQVGSRGRARSAGRRERSKTPSARCLRRRATHRGLAGSPLDPGLCRHAGAVQFQRPRAALLHARQRRRWANCRSISRDKDDRNRASHAIALDLRQRARQGSHLPQGAVVKVVEVPPGPPVLATLLAEIYGPDAATRRAVAAEVQEDVRIRALHRRYRRLLRPAAAAPAHRRSTRTGWNFSASSRATSTTRSRRSSAACRSAIRIAAKTAIRSKSPCACRKAICRWSQTLAVDAGAGQCAARQQGHRRTWRRRQRRRDEAGSPVDLPPRRPLRRNGARRNSPGAYEAPIYGMFAVDDARSSCA